MINVTEWLDCTAEKFPDKIALVDEKKKMTFSELRKKAIALATVLVEKELYKQPIAVLLDKSVNSIVSFCAVAYSGNFYTVIDAEMPDERVVKILDVFEPKAIITHRLADREIHPKIDRIFIEDIEDSDNEALVYSKRNKVIDTDLLYVLFTSGSTGLPKGVTISHRSVVDYIDWVSEEFGISEMDSFGNQAPFYFDNSVLDIYTCLKTGATLYIIPKLLFAQPVKLLDYLLEHKITTIFWVPSALIIVANLHALKKVDLSANLKNVLFCGEVMPAKQLNEWRRHLPGVNYANLYGPTEITDVCTFYRINREFDDAENIPIGRPMRNTDIIVLSEKDEPVKVGEIGELCVRGTSLSFGYYGNPEKTREAFVQNPLNQKYTELIYRTGDLVHYNELGELIYDGRKDFQIKHMGHRIELGEIENAAASVSGVDRCCCLYNDHAKHIMLFWEGSTDREELDVALRSKLPEYMIPSRYNKLQKLPMTGNGKIDRKRLISD